MNASLIPAIHYLGQYMVVVFMRFHFRTKPYSLDERLKYL